MPKPPSFEDFTEINFVVSVFLAGCTPPFWLFIEFAKDPAKDLGLMIITPDLFDIAQAIFDPRRGRSTKPDRRGRKNRRGIGFPDPSDIIGDKIRSTLNPFNPFKAGPGRFIFPLLNVVEGANFLVAVLEGLQDIAFEGLYGVFAVDASVCQEFARFHRQRNEIGRVGTAALPGDRVALPATNLIFQNIVNTLSFQMNSTLSQMEVSLQITLTAVGSSGAATGAIAIVRIDNGQILASTDINIEVGQSKRVNLAATVPPSAGCQWVWIKQNGLLDISDFDVFGYADSFILWD